MELLLIVGLIILSQISHDYEPCLSVMGHVIKVGLDALGTGRSYYLDKDFQTEVQNLVGLGKSPNTLPHEQQHINAVKLWAQGYIFLKT